MPRLSMTFIVHSNGDPRALVGSARQVIRQIDAQQPIVNPRMLDDYASEAVAMPRFRTVLLGVFAGLAVVLALIGLYGVMSYTVTQQTQEIGVRMALGAQQRDIYRFVLREGMLLVATGLALGVASAFELTKFVASFLFGVTPRDSATLAGVVLLFAGVAALACWVPARRAGRVDPMVALRYE
jgi:ABC-type antimicrobial peptide transport system permease subunit